MNDVLSDEEVDALQSDGESGPDGQGSGDPSPYNLASGLANLHLLTRQFTVIDNNIAALLRRQLLGLLHKTAEVNTGELKLLSFQEYVADLAAPTSINSYQLSPGDERIVISLDGSLVFSLLNGFFGGGSRNIEISDREFTGTELRVVQRILDVVMESIHSGWKQLQGATLELLKSESNPALSSAFKPEQRLLQRSFEITFEGGGGKLHLLTTDTLAEHMMLVPALAPPAAELNPELILRQRARGFSATVSGVLSGASMTLHELMHIREGDVIPVDSPEQVDVLVNGVQKFSATSGETDGSVGLRVTKSAPGNNT